MSSCNSCRRWTEIRYKSWRFVWSINDLSKDCLTWGRPCGDFERENPLVGGREFKFPPQLKSLKLWNDLQMPPQVCIFCQFVCWLVTHVDTAPCQNIWTDWDGACQQGLPSPSVDKIWAVVFVCRTRVRTIRTVLCSVVCHYCSQSSRVHTLINSSYRVLSLDFICFVFVRV